MKKTALVYCVAFLATFLSPKKILIANDSAPKGNVLVSPSSIPGSSELDMAVSIWMQNGPYLRNPDDMKTLKKLLNESAKKGNWEARRRLYSLSLTSNSVTEEQETHLSELERRSVEQGNRDAKYYAARNKIFNDDFEIRKQAFLLMNKSAEQGNADAAVFLARVYECERDDDCQKYGISKNIALAKKWSEVAALAGDSRAITNLVKWEVNGSRISVQGVLEDNMGSIEPPSGWIIHLDVPVTFGENIVQKYLWVDGNKLTSEFSGKKVLITGKIRWFRGVEISNHILLVPVDVRVIGK